MKFIAAPRKKYIEILQQKKVRMSFAKERQDAEGNSVVEQMFYWVNCRDFFSDVLYSEQLGEIVMKYGFTYNPNIQQIDRDKTKILLNFSNREDLKNFKNNISILHDIEEANELEKTTYKYVKRGVYLVKGDRYWLSATSLLHTYTFMLKVCAYPIKDKENWFEEMKTMTIHTSEISYLKDATPKLMFLLHNLKQIFKDPPNVHGWKEATITLVHDFSGFKSLFKNSNYIFKESNFYTTSNLFCACIKGILHG